MDLALMVSEFVSPIILVACLCVGYVIKNVGNNEQVNKFIPAIVMALGIVLNIWFVGEVSLPVAVAGMVSGLASTGLYEFFDTTLKGLRPAQ